TNFGKKRFAGESNITSKVDGYTLSAIGSYPLSTNFALVGEAGVLFYKVKQDSSNSPNMVQASSSSKSGKKGFIGGGLKYKLTENIDLLGTYTYYGKVKNDNKTNSANNLNLNNFAANIQYRF
ncbi:MAG: outer membrane beta-barrel protein, partial [Glaciimonas sp.]|nr:outer membrane beta-barrel protein [Glaciimonas sp.]